LQADERATQPSFGFRSDTLGMAMRGKRRDPNAVPALIILL
jgi:hypothetical protein